MISPAQSFRTSLPKITFPFALVLQGAAGVLSISSVGCSASKSSAGVDGGGGAPGGGEQSGLLLWLKLDEASTNGAPADASGMMNMATYGVAKPLVASSVPAAIKGFSNAALKFDGLATVEIPATPAMTWPDNASSFTIAAWANPESLPVNAEKWGSLIANNPGGTGNQGYCGIAIAPDATWSFESNGQDTATGGVAVRGAAVVLGAWQHIAIVQNGAANTQTIYVNGVAGPAQMRGSSPCNSTASFSIGFKDGDGFIGMVDDVRIYGDPLTESQVKELAAGKQTITPTP